MRAISTVVCAIGIITSATVYAGQQTCQGPAKRAMSDFVPSADGLELRDVKTGLIWSRCLEGSVWTGSVCQSQHPKYANVVPANDYNYGEALALAAARSTQIIKWRVPSMKELDTIREPSCYNPSANLSLFPVDPAWSSDGFFWSTNTKHQGLLLPANYGGRYGGRYIMSAIGTSDANSKTGDDQRAYVRLVRTDPDFIPVQIKKKNKR
jgi:Protein of unknown function (DUF1566)